MPPENNDPHQETRDYILQMLETLMAEPNNQHADNIRASFRAMLKNPSANMANESKTKAVMIDPGVAQNHPKDSMTKFNIGAD